MKIAVLADIHGNLHGLDAILADIDQEQPDCILSAGDMIGCSPYPHSPQVWQRLRERGIPKVLGNLEDFVRTCHASEDNPLIQTSVQFRPTQYVARQFLPDAIAEMNTLPMSRAIQGPDGQAVLVCHASPGHLMHSFADPQHAHIATELTGMSASTIVGGHLHRQWSCYRDGKLLVLAGGGALPLQGHHVVEYLLLTYQQQAWQVRYKTIPFAYQAAIDSVLESDFLDTAGPIGWLMFDEILVQQPRLVPFFETFCPHPSPTEWEEWQIVVQRYLTALDRWEVILPHLRERGKQCIQ